MATATQRVWSDEELLALRGPGKYELVDGELVHVSPAGARHGQIALRLSARLHQFVSERRLGYVFEGQTGFRLRNGDLRSPDVSFVASADLPDGVPEGFLYTPPGLAVEVLSPTDRAGAIAHKVAEYLGVGVRLVWIVDSEQRTAVVYRPAGLPRTVREDGSLEGEDVVPGFSFPLSALFG